MMRKRGSFVVAVLLGGSAIGVLGDVVVTGVARAGHTGCDNEARLDQGGDDFLVDVGPGLASVGVDKGDASAGTPSTTESVAACYRVGAVNGSAGVDRGDRPRTVPGTECELFVAGCRLTEFQLWTSDGDANGIVHASVAGAPAGNGAYNVHSPSPCVGVLMGCP